MAKITITLPDTAAEIAEKHARELGYEDASDWVFELLRNYAATREDALYTRMHPGEHNPVFGRSRREIKDAERRAAAPKTVVKEI
jgi:Arc/MetJ-type ribon-helix-helix transcriptional regulator